MTSRRRARSNASVSPAGAPRELFDLESPHWASVVAAREWLLKRGVRPPLSLDAEGGNRFLILRSVITAWMVASGRVSAQFPTLPDQHFMVASGLARVRSECLRRGVASTPSE